MKAMFSADGDPGKSSVAGLDGLRYTRVVRKNTNQNGILSAVGHSARHLPHWKTRKNHKAKLENSYVGHPEDLRHRSTGSSGSDKTLLATPSWSRPRFSSFKGIARKRGMEPSQQEIQPPKPEDKGATGLMNMRNTCYLNSALQAFRHNTEISAFFLENKHEEWISKKTKSPKVELVAGYADLLKSLWSGSRPAYIRPEGFLQSMFPAAKAAGFDHFLVPEQHDSHEFLTFLLDQLHEGMAEEVSIEIRRPAPTNDHERAIQSALEAWKNIFGKQYSPLTEMIYGLLRTTYTCQGCQKSRDMWESFNCIKLPLHKEKSSFEEMLKEEFKDEEIPDYECETCKPNRTTVVCRRRIWRLPRMVSLAIKRFTPDGRKIHTRIQFNQEEPITFGNYFSDDSPEPSKTQSYECFATIDHHGSAGGGHYTSQAKSPLSEKWHLFDDENVYPLENPQFGESTYVLFLKPSTPRGAPAAPA